MFAAGEYMAMTQSEDKDNSFGMIHLSFISSGGNIICQLVSVIGTDSTSWTWEIFLF
jgi:hypothetical protein